jgi:glycine oxidase
VTVLESDLPGGGASGSPVGAMSPHLPANWAPKKEFQLAALLSAKAHWHEVAMTGGSDPGYARIGRLIPLADAAARHRAEAQAEAAAECWPGEMGWTLHSRTPDEGWIASAAAAHGVAFEPLSARIHPRRAVDALAAAVTGRGVALAPGIAVLGIEDGAVRTCNRRFEAVHVVLAAGLGGFDLVKDATGHPGGRGVKGQAAVLGTGGPVGNPAIFAQGIYVVPHADGTVAVGSTSEDAWDDATATDGLLNDLMLRAQALCPRLAGARLLERWAGLRPRAPRPDPMVGPLPGFDRVFLATGAFKIGFGIAHAVGAAVADLVTGRDPMLPSGFSPIDHGLPQRDVILPISGGTGPV